MKKVILILICLISMTTLCGCTSSRDKQGITESNIQYINRVGVKDKLVCIDGVEYIYIVIGYSVGMAPHLAVDENNNPKVIRCKR